MNILKSICKKITVLVLCIGLVPINACALDMSSLGKTLAANKTAACLIGGLVVAGTALGYYAKNKINGLQKELGDSQALLDNEKTQNKIKLNDIELAKATVSFQLDLAKRENNYQQLQFAQLSLEKKSADEALRNTQASLDQSDENVKNILAGLDQSQEVIRTVRQALEAHAFNQKVLLVTQNKIAHDTATIDEQIKTVNDLLNKAPQFDTNPSRPTTPQQNNMDRKHSRETKDGAHSPVELDDHAKEMLDMLGMVHEPSTIIELAKKQLEDYRNALNNARTQIVEQQDKQAKERIAMVDGMTKYHQQQEHEKHMKEEKARKEAQRLQDFNEYEQRRAQRRVQARAAQKQQDAQQQKQAADPVQAQAPNAQSWYASWASKALNLLQGTKATPAPAQPEQEYIPAYAEPISAEEPVNPRHNPHVRSHQEGKKRSHARNLARRQKEIDAVNGASAKQNR